jgi:hypothetical protein
MTNSEKALVTLRFVKQEYEVALREFMKADADQAATIAAHNVWEEHNEDDGLGMASANPYNIESAHNLLRVKKEKLDIWNETYEFAVETFMHKLDAGLADHYNISTPKAIVQKS